MNIRTMDTEEQISTLTNKEYIMIVMIAIVTSLVWWVCVPYDARMSVCNALVGVCMNVVDKFNK